MLTQARLKELLHYDPETGIFTWVAPTSDRMKPGQVAGCGFRYVYISIDYRSYPAHRLAWLYMTGVWPKSEVDHENRNRKDNRWRNLRAASGSQNKCNSTRPNKTGMRGVYLNKGKYQVQVTKHGVCHSGGTYSTPEEAHAAACALRSKLHGEFATHEALP